MERLVIQSDIKNITQVEFFVDAICDHWNINNYAATIAMPLLQAVENAIVHGNHSDPAKRVSITADTCKGGVSFAVEDEGRGFDYTSFGELPEEQGRGTGLFLMRTLADRLTFDNGGSRVEMMFVINGIDPARALERITTLSHFYQPKHVMA